MPVGTHTHDSPGSGNSAAALYSNRTIQTNAPTTLPGADTNEGYSGSYFAADLSAWPSGGILTTGNLESLRKSTNQLALKK